VQSETETNPVVTRPSRRVFTAKIKKRTTDKECIRKSPWTVNRTNENTTQKEILRAKDIHKKSWEKPKTIKKKRSRRAPLRTKNQEEK